MFANVQKNPVVQEILVKLVFQVLLQSSKARKQAFDTWYCKVKP